ncbi:hypothetical protein BCR37DRAFT_162594 [Protomyces lactucae-debilis]|uniref:Uncharacterized protein n=1 Tax=Protomyces lactucae-debilis TaxID=2754530 RepID=A0A1Y2EZW1_PROLT|nr:uncharacterized protein BCR37DRAFT_162594 [Protomyces lactucae-debilis]ORY76656.1 hypothetical protein BCR37DRAFT_162594 [Protomyces lactucae-debilis]
MVSASNAILWCTNHRHETRLCFRWVRILFARPICFPDDMFRSRAKKRKEAHHKEEMSSRLRISRYPESQVRVQYLRPEEFVDQPRRAPTPANTIRSTLTPMRALQSDRSQQSVKFVHMKTHSPKHSAGSRLLSMQAIVSSNAAGQDEVSNLMDYNISDLWSADWNGLKDALAFNVATMQRASSGSKNSRANPSNDAADATQINTSSDDLGDSHVTSAAKVRLTGDIRLAGSSGSSPLLAQYRRRLQEGMPAELPVQMPVKDATGFANGEQAHAGKPPSTSSLTAQCQPQIIETPENHSPDFEARLDALQTRLDELQIKRRSVHEEFDIRDKIADRMAQRDEQHESVIAKHGVRMDLLERANIEADQKLAVLQAQIDLCKEALALLQIPGASSDGEPNRNVQPLVVSKHVSSSEAPTMPSSAVDKGKSPDSAAYRASKARRREKESMQRYKQECMQQYDLMRARQAHSNHDKVTLPVGSISHVSITPAQYSTHSVASDSPIVPRTMPLMPRHANTMPARKPIEPEVVYEEKAELMYFRPVRIDHVGQQKATHIMRWESRRL